MWHLTPCPLFELVSIPEPLSSQNIDLLFPSGAGEGYCLTIWGQRRDLRGLNSCSDFQPVLQFPFPCLTSVCSGSWYVLIPAPWGVCIITCLLFVVFLSAALDFSFLSPAELVTSCLPALHLLEFCWDLSSVAFFFPLSLCVFIHFKMQSFYWGFRNLQRTVFILLCLNGSCSLCAEKVGNTFDFHTKPHPCYPACHPGLWPLSFPVATNHCCWFNAHPSYS